jgi:lipopolysaccharide/colanic/teichoic acid biosynthesis glycosyltransferase
VEPGVTGLAQITRPPDTDLDSVRRKLVLDRQYIETASVWLDLRILIQTVLSPAAYRNAY